MTKKELKRLIFIKKMLICGTILFLCASCFVTGLWWNS